MFKKVMSVFLTLMLVISSVLVSGIGVYAADPSERLTVNATSNYFPQNSVTVAEGEEYVTVTYLLTAVRMCLICSGHYHMTLPVLNFKIQLI